MRRGRHSTSSSSAFDQPSSSHLNDDDDGNNEGTSRASTPSPIHFVNSITNEVPQMSPPHLLLQQLLHLQLLQMHHQKLYPSIKPHQSKRIHLLLFNQNFKFHHRLQMNQLLLKPLQNHPSLDITLSLSPITPLDHILDTPSPPSAPQPQPPIMGHPLYYNYHDYHGSTCISRRNNLVHRRLWVLKAHDGKSQVSSVYYIERLNHNLFSIGQFCNANLEVALRKSTCYVDALKGNDLLTGSRGTNLYLITLQERTSPNLICLMTKASSSQAWL
ncbi:hypothetical protein Tco_0920973 [Tanacetum coccineum]